MGEVVTFSVATNFQPDFLDAISGHPVSEIFGKLPMDETGGGRSSYMLSPLTKKAFARHVSEARARGIGFNYLVNPACLDNREFTRAGQQGLERVLDFAEESGATAVTISLPFLLPIIKRRHPRLKVRVGVYARVDNVSKARCWEEMGADCITLESLSVNRDFAMLAAIREAVGAELQLIVNANCMMYCPLAGQHMVNLSHSSQKGHRSRGFVVDWCALKCSADRLREPVNYLRSDFIRPEDLGEYVKLGYTSFKVLERGAPTSVMAKRVKAYSERTFDGNLLELIQPYGYKEKSGAGMGGRLRFWSFFLRPGSMRLASLMKLKRLAEARGMTAPLEGEPVCIDNRALDGFLAGFRDRDCRQTDCDSCGWCDSWAKKAVRVDGEYSARLLKMYEESFGELYSGAAWGM